MMSDPGRFPDAFDHRMLRMFSGQTGAGHSFGTGVLDTLVKGVIDHHVEHDRAMPDRSLGPALLGAFLWLDDEELIKAIADYPAACVVVSKQPEARGRRRAAKQATIERLQQICNSREGFPAFAMPELENLATRKHGRPQVLGPYSELPRLTVPRFRSIGFRRSGEHLVPILHTKMLLVGHLWWRDEHPAGFPEDTVGFTPQRLWLGSANGTRSSRRSLEFGVWLTEPDLLSAARRFLAEVIRYSEDIDSTSSPLAPEFAHYEFDDEAMAAAAAGMDLWEIDDTNS